MQYGPVTKMIHARLKLVNDVANSQFKALMTRPETCLISDMLEDFNKSPSLCAIPSTIVTNGSSCCYQNIWKSDTADLFVLAGSRLRRQSFFNTSNGNEYYLPMLPSQC